MKTTTNKYLLLTFFSIFLFGGHNAPSAQAAESITVPVRATLLQCGKKAEIKQSCARDSRCCVFLQPHERPAQIAKTNANKMAAFKK